MKRLQFLALGLVLVRFAGLAPAALAETPALTLSWESRPPTVEGVAAGGSVAFLAVVREPLGDSQRVHLIRQVVQAGVGETRVAIPWIDSEVPPRSVWAVVDETTGSFVLGSPAEELVPIPQRAELVEGVGALAFADQWLEVLLVRPGGGQWGGSVIDGSASDQDGQADGSIELDPASLPALANAPTLAAWALGDVLIAIDIDTFVVSTAVVGGAP